MTLPTRRRRDPTKSRAVIATSLVLVAVFVAERVSGFGLAPYLALIPQELARALQVLPGDPTSGDAWLSLSTVFGMLLVHADVMHLAFNIAYFWFFGTLLAQVAGERWVFISLLVCAITSAIALVVFRGAGPPVPVIGASGAISGVAGFYVLLAFRWDVPWAMAWPLARPVPAPRAALVAILATALDVYALQSGGGGAVAQDAHIGGFAGGLLLGAVLTSFFPTWERFRASWAGAGAR